MTAVAERVACAARTRDGRPCGARATTTIDTPADVPVDVHGAATMDVCGTHRITYDEAAAEHGPVAAALRILTGRRPQENDRWN